MDRILIIDDHDQIRQMLQRRLTKLGYHVVFANDGESAKKLLKQEPIDLILLDYLLPSYTGFDFFVDVQKELKIPFIMMTAHPSLHLAIEFLREGGADFIEKPIDVDVLDIKIQRAILNDKRIKEEKEARLRAELELKNSNNYLKAQTVMLKDMNSQLDAFASSVSHDLKSPLRLINSFSQLLKQRYIDQLDDQGKEYINTIVRSSQKMYVLINDLLYLSKTSTQHIELKEIDLSIFIPTLIEEILANYPDVKTEVKAHDLPTIQGDKTLIYQLYYNLIDNALKYSSHNDIAKLQIGAEVKEGKTFVYIKDNGVGFDMQYVDKIFDIFVRLHKESEFKGTGVGLASVKRIVNRHSGEIFVESELGQGTTFYIYLPNQSPLLSHQVNNN